MYKIAMGAAAGLLGLVLAGCGGRGDAPNTTVMLPPMGDLAMFATLPKDTIGEELPGEGLGSIKSVKWKATLAGFSQRTYSQSLAFPPDTKLTIHNLSTKYTHTLDVVKAISKPPAVFPHAPKLSVQAKGDGKLEVGYASGPIKLGKTITVTLSKAGTYLIGCAFHYDVGMHDVLVVEPHAVPGPQATPTPHGGGSGSGSGSGSGWGG